MVTLSVDWALVGLILVGFLALAARIGIKAFIERSVQSASDRTLEALKSELRAKEGKLNNLQARLLDGRAGLHSQMQSRRLNAVENLWKATIRLNAFRYSASMLTVLKLSAIEKRLPTEPNLQKFMSTLSGGDLKEKIQEIAGDEQRLFVPTDTWKLFDAYQTLLIVCYMRLTIVSLGLEDADKILDLETMMKKLKDTMPHFNDFLDKHGLSGAARLVDPLRELLFESLRAASSTADDDEKYAEQMTNALTSLDSILARHATS